MAPALPQLPIGKQGLKASKCGLGCMGMSSYYTVGEASDEESLKVLARAHELGVTMLDTSNVYGFGINERLIAKALEGGNRDNYVIATKFGFVLKEDGTVGVRGDAQHVKEACEQSLKDLGVEQIDLWYIHRPDPSVRIEETVQAMADLVSEGKVRHIGLSGEVSSEQIRKANAVHPISAVQLEWSLFERSAERDVIPTCRELGIGIVCYSPLGRGFLTGELRSADDIPESDFRKRLPRYSPENFGKNLELVRKVEEVARKTGTTPGQIALAWLNAQGDDVFPIPGTKRLARLEENVAAFSIRLTEQELKELDEAFPPDAAAGSRFPEGW
jgi:aryl-alcohol dehydrogenase-like predicted oxidoreductase